MSGRAGWLAATIALVWLLALAPHVALAAPAADALTETPLVYLNRKVYTMRATVAGTPPAERAERALERLQALPVEQLGQTISVHPVDHQGERGLALKLGDAPLFTVFASDLDPEAGMSLEATAAVSVARLADAFEARQQLRQPAVLARSLLASVLGLLVIALCAWLAGRLLAAMDRRLRGLIAQEASAHRIAGIDWSGFGFRAVTGATRLLSWTGLGVLSFLWVTHSLRQFAATAPLAEEMGDALLGGLATVALTLWHFLPNLGMILLVVLAARGIVAALDQLFTNAGRGRVRVPGVHPETARATRRLAVFGTWSLALVIAYPYIPGSDSTVFRGLSVFLGFIFTLGSTGVVSQWMHGMVLVYSRALRAGDFVRIGDHEGVVQELGALSVKIADYRGNEVTLPNSSVVAGSVINHSRLAEPGAVRASVTLSIGYDVPWRQVHQLMLKAADDTPGVRSAPPPRVFQRALADHSVAYELSVEIAGARLRAQAVSSLYEHLQDAFDAAGVAILSPIYVASPTAVPVELPGQAKD